MFAVRPFDGTPEELSQFVISAWESTYAGTMAVPHWSGDYFRWQLRLDEPQSADRTLTIYDGETPAGTMLHFPMTFQIAGEVVEAAQASWLSVPPEYRGKGIAHLLSEETRKVLRAQGRRFKLGFGYFGSKKSLGVRFWKKAEGKSVSFGKRVGFWARVLNPLNAAKWNVNRWEGRLTGIVGPFLKLSKPGHTSGIQVRPVQAADVPRCLELAELATQPCEMRLIWDENRLARQLGIHGYSQALVAEEQGEVRGCIGYHVLPIHGMTLENVGVLDLVFISELSSRARTELLNTALWRLRELGCVVALKLRTGDYPTGTFLRWDWFCKPADSQVLITWTHQPEQLPPCRRLHILWR